MLTVVQKAHSEVVLQLTVSLASYGLIGKLEEPETLGRFSSRAECLIEFEGYYLGAALGALYERGGTDGIVSCIAYERIPDCERDILLGRDCINVIEFGPQKRVILYRGSKSVQNSDLVQVIPEQYRLRKKPYSVLQVLIFGEFDEEIVAYIGSQRVYDKALLLPLLKTPYDECDAAISSERYSRLTKGLIAPPERVGFKISCFSVSANGSVELDYSKIIMGD